jgi:SP family myo-inositol transporter-like MFS transporter 13
MHNLGLTAQIVPVYISKRSPARLCGRMISVDMIFIGTRSVLAYAFNSAFQHVPHGWTYMVSLGA